MKYLFLYPHQVWPMHYFHGGVLARALINEGHEVLWVNCQRTFPGCHAQWIVPDNPAESVCNDCEQRTNFIADKMGIQPRPLSDWLTDEDRAEAALVREIDDARALQDWMDGDIPVGYYGLSSPASCERMLDLDDMTPTFMPKFRQGVENAILSHRALRKILDEEGIDRVAMHLGRLPSQQVLMNLCKTRGLTWYSWETGEIRNALALRRNTTLYDYSFCRDLWADYKDAPLTLAEMETVTTWMQARRQSGKKTGRYTFSPQATSPRELFEALELPPTENVVALFTSSVDETSFTKRMEDPTFTPVFEDQYEMIGDAIEWARGRPDFTLVIRIHPNESARANHLGMEGTKALNLYHQLFERIAPLPENVKVVWPDEKVSSYTLIDVCKAVIVYRSTTGIEAAVVGRPVICTENPPWRDAGFEFLVPSRERFSEYIEAALAADEDEMLHRATLAWRFSMHNYLKFLIPFSLVKDHGRMMMISLGFSDPARLKYGMHPGLDAALDNLIKDAWPFPAVREGWTDTDVAWERAMVQGRLRPRPSLTEMQAAPPPPAVEDLRDTFQADLALLLAQVEAGRPTLLTGPLAPSLPEIFTDSGAKPPVLIDEEDAGRRARAIHGQIGGPAAALPFSDRCAALVAVAGGLGRREDAGASLDAYRRWLRPQGRIWLYLEPAQPDNLWRPGLRGLEKALTERGFIEVFVRQAPDGGLLAIGRVPGAMPDEAITRREADPVRALMPPTRLADPCLLDVASGRVLAARREDGAWSCWPEHLDGHQPVPPYYLMDRPEVRALIPQGAERVLDVGCAGGGLGRAIKQAKPTVVVDGVEVVERAARHADEHLDQVFTGPVEQVVPRLEDGRYDAVVFADVLEHLVDPGVVLDAIKPKLSDDGVLVISLPNVRHWSVVGPLLEGRFTYEDAGILDRTHLRFFTRASIQDLFAAHGYDIVEMKQVRFGGAAPASVVEALAHAPVNTGTLADESGVYQYLLVARPQPKRPPKLTSIVLLAWNQLEYTRMCIESVLTYTRVPYELILVDNGSVDGTGDYFRDLAARHDHVKVVLNRKNLGFAKGCNQGLARADGDYVMFLNNDTIVTEGWLGRMQWWIELEPNIGIVGPVSNRVAGIQQVNGVGYDEDDPRAMIQMHAWAAAYCAKQHQRSTFVSRLIGLCLLVKRGVIDRIGGFDVGFGTGNFEDDDFCIRAKVAGYNLLIAHDVFIHHYGSKTFIGNRVDYQQTFDQNMSRFLGKWGFEREGNGYRATGLDEIVYDRARHFAPYGREEGFRPEAAPVQVEEAGDQNVLVLPPWSDDEALVGLLRSLHDTAEVARARRCTYWLRTSPEEGPLRLKQLSDLSARVGLSPDQLPDVLLVDAPLSPEREAGLFTACDAVWIDRDWPEADVAARRAMDCESTIVDGTTHLNEWLSAST